MLRIRDFGLHFLHNQKSASSGFLLPSTLHWCTEHTQQDSVFFSECSVLNHYFFQNSTLHYCSKTGFFERPGDHLTEQLSLCTVLEKDSSSNLRKLSLSCRECFGAWLHQRLSPTPSHIQITLGYRKTRLFKDTCYWELLFWFWNILIQPVTSKKTLL